MELPTPIKRDGKVWNWSTYSKNENSPQVLFLKLKYSNPVTEQEFVDFMVSQPKSKLTANPPSKRKSRYKKTYHYLKNEWGFFPSK